MRIVLDLQGAQTTGSRNRGIGRYTLSLAQAMLRNRREHEVFIALNGLFPDTIESIRATFDGLLPQDHILVWQAPASVNQSNHDNTGRRKAAELLRESFLASLKPDVLHVSSLFEGLSDDAITSIACFTRTIPTAVTLYDLIPHINPHPYLENPQVKDWYEGKLDHLRRASLWLAISESSRQEGMLHLGLPADAVTNISAAAEPHFHPVPRNEPRESALRTRYGLSRPFVMYTGGIDHRKNVEGLIRSYARLPKALRHAHQLVIVCSVHLPSRHALEQLAARQGLEADEVVLTGFVPEEDLPILYNLCKLFIFPSWHEGFGLPALEAMSCGAAVIAANTSSLPEVIGRDDALFDPHSEESIAQKLIQALTNHDFRAGLARHGIEQAKRFSWDESARRAIDAFERFHRVRNYASREFLQPPPRRPKLAFVSPLPPEQSGIADYSAELLPELARHYDIEVVVVQEQFTDSWVRAICTPRTPDWLRANAARMDRVLFHFGNSHFHQHMFALLEDVPGVVVLHDFFLSGIVSLREMSGAAPQDWARALYRSHGYAAVRDRYHTPELAEVIWRYPVNLGVLQRAQGVIVHAEYSRRLARQWYGESFPHDWAVIPHLRVRTLRANREESRRVLGLKSGYFVVCSMGLLGPTKLNHRLLDAWLNSRLAENENCVLVFAGQNQVGEYGEQLLRTIQASGFAHRIRISGWSDMSTYRNYLAAADVGVQLRTLSRGETSGTVLDCMNYGLPTIVNANGSMADLPPDAVWMLPDEFQTDQLTEALESLWQDDARRKLLGARAKTVILNQHDPRRCAEQYAQAIEHFHVQSQSGVQALVDAVTGLDVQQLNDADCREFAQSIAQNHPEKRPAHQLLVDISEWVHRHPQAEISTTNPDFLMELIDNPPCGYRVEPVYVNPDTQGILYARDYTLGLLGCPMGWLEDAPIETQPGDIWLGISLQAGAMYAHEEHWAHLRRLGVACYHFSGLKPQDLRGSIGNWRSGFGSDHLSPATQVKLANDPQPNPAGLKS